MEAEVAVMRTKDSVEGQETGFLLELPEGRQTCRYLNFISIRLFLTSDLVIALYCFKILNL